MESALYYPNYPKVHLNIIDKEQVGNFLQTLNHIVDGIDAEKFKLPALRPVASKLLQNLIKTFDGWNFSVKDMCKRVMVGETALITGRKELVEKGYLKIIRYQDEDTGRFLVTRYFVSEIAEYLKENELLKDENGNFKRHWHVEKVSAETFTKSDSLPFVKNPKVARPKKADMGTNNTYNTNIGLEEKTTIQGSEFIENETDNDSAVASFSFEKVEECITEESEPEHATEVNPEQKSSDVHRVEKDSSGPAPAPATSPETEKMIEQLQAVEIGEKTAKKLIRKSTLADLAHCIKKGIQKKKAGEIENLAGWIINSILVHDYKAKPDEAKPVFKKAVNSDQPPPEMSLVEQKKKKYSELFKMLNKNLTSEIVPAEPYTNNRDYMVQKLMLKFSMVTPGKGDNAFRQLLADISQKITFDELKTFFAERLLEPVMGTEKDLLKSDLVEKFLSYYQEVTGVKA